jgi:hypothetical protein
MDEPGGITQQIDVASVANAKARSRAVAIELSLVNDLAKRRGVEQPAKFARS